MADPKTEQFWKFMEVCKEFWNGRMKNVLAFHLGVWKGEEARKQATGDGTDAELVLNFELGIQCSAELKAAGKQVMQALLAAAVAAIIEGIKNSGRK